MQNHAIYAGLFDQTLDSYNMTRWNHDLFRMFQGGNVDTYPNAFWSLFEDVSKPYWAGTNRIFFLEKNPIRASWPACPLDHKIARLGSNQEAKQKENRDMSR